MLALEGEFRGRLESLLDHPLVTDVRGMGFFYAVGCGRKGEPLSDEEHSFLCEEFLSRRLPELGLICRVDDLAPGVGLSPPLTAGGEEFDQITAILQQGLDEAWSHIEGGNLEISSPRTRRMPAAAS